MCTHIHEQRQTSDPLHGQDEEGDHGEVPAVWVALDPGQHLLESWILGPAKEDLEFREKSNSQNNEWRGKQTPRFKVSGQSSERDMIRAVFVFSLGHSHQPLQGSLLVDLIGAVGDVRIKVGLSVLADNVADVIDHNALLVPFLQFLEKPEQGMI